jgi:NAD(P)-dependent dehydrogenase (short-subunit alcohol dehydrogenase family)
MKIEGAAALVTGANRGLGAATAQALLDSGAKVYGAARDSTTITNQDVIPVLLDVNSVDDIASAARTCGDVSIVVNNAGILRQNGGGALVNVLSVLSFISMPQGATYSASKAAAWSLTNALRIELRRQGTLVVAVHAGFIDTDMAAGVTGEKISPQSVAQQIVAALAADAEEVLADPTSEMVKAACASASPRPAARRLREPGQGGSHRSSDRQRERRPGEAARGGSDHCIASPAPRRRARRDRQAARRERRPTRATRPPPRRRTSTHAASMTCLRHRRAGHTPLSRAGWR